jgi:hypothetical protein
MFITTGQFVQERLPQLMAGRPAFRVLLATYNDLGMEVDDVLKHLGRGLEVTTRAGNLEYSPQEVLNTLSPPAARKRMEAEASAAQSVVERAIRQDATCYDLAVVYVGLLGFDRSFAYAAGLKKYDRASSVVVLTCDCDLKTKEAKLASSVDSGLISSAIITKWCGGQRELANITVGLVAQWDGLRNV